MFSLGIPVRNEENNIGDLIKSSFNQSVLPNEILVCLNGSKDRTHAILSETQKDFPNIRILESKPGKANAWNRIVKETKDQQMIFCDGDIDFGSKDTFQRLLYELNERKLSMLGASIIQLPSKRITPYKLRLPSGQLYAIDLGKAGIFSIPSHIINEDLFLALHCYHSVDVIGEAFFYSNKPNILDFYHTQVRILKGIKQILDLGLEGKLTDMLEKKGYPKLKIKLVLKLAKIIDVKENDNLWKETISTKGKINIIS